MTAFVRSIFIPLAVGGLAGILTMNSMRVYEDLVLPSLSPPSWVFPVVWTVLYILMGIASYLVYRSDAVKAEKQRALVLYAVQLVFNFIWPILFFGLQNYLASFIWLVLLWILILATTVSFSKISKPAAWLMVPYLLWVTFAGYLNLSVYLLNR